MDGEGIAIKEDVLNGIGVNGWERGTVIKVDGNKKS